MPVPVDPSTGRIAHDCVTYDDARRKGYVVMPDPVPQRPVSYGIGVPSSAPLKLPSQTSVSAVGYTPTDWKGFGWFVVVSVLAWFVYIAASDLSPYLRGDLKITDSELFRAQPVEANGIDTYAGSDVMKFRWIHDKDHPMHLNGRTVIVTGDVSNANIHVNGNVTFEGTLRNVSVVDNDWTITANRVENSTLTARKIVVADAIETTENIVPAAVVHRQGRKGR